MEHKLLVTEAEIDQGEYNTMHWLKESIVQVVKMKQETTTQDIMDITINDVSVGNQSVTSNVEAKTTSNDNFVSFESDQGGSGGVRNGPGDDTKIKLFKPSTNCWSKSKL